MMKTRTLAKLGVGLSVILFCIGVTFYCFAHFSMTEGEWKVRLLSLVPADCIGVFETDNIDLLPTELLHAAYADKFDSVYTAGLLPLLFEDLAPYAENDMHGLGNSIGRLIVSFHNPLDEKAMVVYFSTTTSGSKLFGNLLRKKGIDFSPKTEHYHGKKIVIFPLRNGDFLSTYSGKGFVTASFQKRLIEKVIDTERDGSLFEKNVIFQKVYRPKSANFMTLYGQTASFPLLADDHPHEWSEFDIHLGRDVLYLNGLMQVADTCLSKAEKRLGQIPSVEEEPIFILSGTEKIDSCITYTSALPERTSFEECVSNLSSEAIYAMVADIDKVIENPQPYKEYLPPFVYDHLSMFRSFIFSLQITKAEGALSHLLVFTCKK